MDIVRLDEVRATDRARVGGKAANLGELLASGFPVPPGFVICAEASAAYLEELDLGADLRALEGADAATVATHSAHVRRRIEQAELPPPLATALREAHLRLLAGRGDEVRCAVRSSATAEDLGAASFAGQHGTYYYVDAEHLSKRVRQCWASLWSPEAISYRATHGIDSRSVAMAVVVQEMIPAEVAGVTFTLNPVTGERDELIVESCWGMGAALVDGRVSPDRFVLRREDLAVLERRIADKRLMVAPRLEADQQARLETVPLDHRTRESLGPGDLRLVAEWALRAEAHFGQPQDVEWAWSAGRFWLLQSRPVTVVGREEVGRGICGRWVLFKPIAENFTEPLTPLSEDMVRSVMPPAGLRVIRGWVYLDVAVLEWLLPFQASPEELADHVYSLSRDGPDWNLDWSKLPPLLLAGLAGFLVCAVPLARVRALPDSALDGGRDLARRLADDDSVAPEQVLRQFWLLPSIFAPMAHMPAIVNLCSAIGFPWLHALRRLLDRWVPDFREEAEVLLSSGSEGVLSAEMGRGIVALAATARRSPRVRGILEGETAERALAALRAEPEAGPFLEALAAFLAQNGHRAVKEFELRSPRFEEEPSVVLGMVRNALGLGPARTDHEGRAAQARERLAARLRESLAALPLERATGLRFRLILAAAERARYYLKLRENSRFYHIMGPAIVRSKVTRIEALLIHDGRLKCKDDVFFLTFAELSGLQAGRLGWLDVEDLVRERRIEHIRLSKLGPRKTIGFELRPRPRHASAAGDNLRLEGRGASPGRYQGRARIILDPTVDSRIEPGEVLVAPYTDPAWTPLFLTAGAAVVEVGSYLSHAGTVAREFGMPCVVDVPEATRRIRSGDLLDVDADSGRVCVLETGASP